MAKKRKKSTVPAIKPADFGREVLKLLKQGWTKHTWADDEHHESCDPLGEKAQCWCLAGAYVRAVTESRDLPRGPVSTSVWYYSVVRTEEYKAAELVWNRLVRLVTTVDDPDAVVKWNDAPGRTAAEVQALLDRVIAELEAEDAPAEPEYA